MRQLPRNKSVRHQVIIQAVSDYFGEGQPLKEKPIRKNISLWLMNRRKGVRLTDEQKEVISIIRMNMEDTTYLQNLSAFIS